MIAKVDTHVHFWDPKQLNYSWLEGAGDLNRAFLPNDYKKASASAGIEKMVFVECNAEGREFINEVEWVSSLVAEDDRLKAIVAYVDFFSEDLVMHLDALSAFKMVRGVRHNIQGNEPGFCLQPAYVKGVQQAAAKGFSVELCLTHDQLADCIELVAQCPDVRLMLNHCGKPSIKSGLIDEWAENMNRLAAFDNVSCKLSGLLTEADFDTWNSEDILPYLSVAVSAFGNDRIVYGGDWPVITLAAQYSDWQMLIDVFTSHWPEASKEKFFRTNAEDFYRI